MTLGLYFKKYYFRFVLDFVSHLSNMPESYFEVLQNIWDLTGWKLELREAIV